MKVDGYAYRAIFRQPGVQFVTVVDQTVLPHRFAFRDLATEEEVADAIRTMVVRGAPLIGVTGAYGLAIALDEDASDAALAAAHRRLLATRPTAVNLRWALDIVHREVAALPQKERAQAAFAVADRLAEEDVATNAAIAENGLALVRKAWEDKGGAGPVNILTHCNTGWIACVDWGTALGIVYRAHDDGIPVHVWVDETRPRNQGALLTAFELRNHGVPHTVIADNAGGLLMMRGQVDAVIVGTDRVTANGDVCNKIGTYLKALAAKDNGVPFHVALPSSTIDWTLESGRDIPIEERSADELLKMTGRLPDGGLATVEIAAPGSGAANPGFDVTPARLVTGFITERGTCAATEEGLRALFPKEETK